MLFDLGPVRVLINDPLVLYVDGIEEKTGLSFALRCKLHPGRGALSGQEKRKFS
jgi:hypothetical protein